MIKTGLLAFLSNSYFYPATLEDILSIITNKTTTIGNRIHLYVTYNALREYSAN